LAPTEQGRWPGRGGTDGLWAARVRAAGHFFVPAPGLYIPIPSEYSTWGVVPALDFIDQLMKHLGRSYCVGLLSAAEIHGAAHQRPQVFQVFADKHAMPARPKFLGT